MVKGVIFDFNGTLYFDTDKHEEAWRLYFRKYEGREIGPTEFRDNIHGKAFDAIFDYYIGSDSMSDRKKDIIREKEALYREVSRKDQKNLRLVDGAEALLDDLKAKKIPFTIATASEITNINFYFEVFPIQRWFSSVDQLIYDDGTFPGKPAPDTYLKAAEKIKVAPKDCLVVEDSIAGLESARRAGIGTLVAMNPGKDREKIEKMPDVAAIIENFNGFWERFLS